MALGLLDIKRRIRSVKNTQKITKAVGMVATSKFGKVRSRLYKVNPYYEGFRDAVNRMLSSGTIESEYLKPGNSDKDLYIIITSDSGMCGNYNANIINTAIKSMKDKSTPIITVGERGRSYFARRGFNTIAEFIEVGDDPSNKDVEEIAASIIKSFKEGQARNVYMVYTKFTSRIRQDAEVLMVLPLKGEEGSEAHGIEFDPSAGEVFEYTLPLYLKALVFYVLTNGIASEYAIRIRSMDGATQNASDLLNKLQVMYNKARQSSITQEITEIVSGAEALRD